MSDKSEHILLLESWHSALKRATDFDEWGQPVEASDIYDRLSKQLFQHAKSKDVSFFTKHEKRTLENIASCLVIRRKQLVKNESHHKDGVTLDNLKHLKKVLTNLHKSDCVQKVGDAVPTDFQFVNQSQEIFDDCEISADDFPLTQVKNALLPKPSPSPGKTYLTVSIDQIGVKDGSQFIDPFISLSVRDHNGQSVDFVQDTPNASSKLDKTIIFHSDVHIQRDLESFQTDFAIFFEFKHFKPKKDSLSTWCWTFVERDEIKEGPLALELYKKPTDFKRKSLKLLTVKPHFLHLQFILYQ